MADTPTPLAGGALSSGDDAREPFSDRLERWLQEDGAKSFVGSWNELLGVIASKSAALGKAS